jgi:hypothetical protein
MDESRGGVEANRQSLLAGRETEPETDVRLAGATVADRDDVLSAGHILRAGELHNEDVLLSDGKLGAYRHDAALVSRPKYVFADVIATWRQIRVDCHVEARRSPFDAAQHQVLHGIDADCSARDGRATSTALVMNWQLPAGQRRSLVYRVDVLRSQIGV